MFHEQPDYVVSQVAGAARYNDAHSEEYSRKLRNMRVQGGAIPKMAVPTS